MEKALRLTEAEVKRKMKLERKLEEAEGLYDDGQYSRVELQSLQRHVNNSISEINAAANARLARVREKLDAARRLRALKKAGLQPQTDIASSLDLLQAAERAQAVDWKALQDAVSSDRRKDIVSSSKSTGKGRDRESKKEKKETKKERREKQHI